MPGERRSSESFDSFPVSSKPTPNRVLEQQQPPIPRQPLIIGLSNVSDEDTSMAARSEVDLSLRGFMNNNGRMGTAAAPTSPRATNAEGLAHANNNNNNTHDDEDVPPPLSNPRRAQSNDNDQYQRQVPLTPFGEVNLMATPSPSSSSSPPSPPPSASSSPQTANNNNNRAQQNFDNTQRPFPRFALVPPKGGGGVGCVGTDDELSKPLISGEADDVDIYVHGGKQVSGEYTNSNTTGGPPRDTPTFRYDQYHSHPPPRQQQQQQEGEQNNKHQQGTVGAYGGEAATHFVGHNGGGHYEQYHQHHNEAGLSSSPTPPYRSPAGTGGNAHHGTFSTSLASENTYSPPSLLPTRTAEVVSNNKGKGGVPIFFNNGHPSSLHPFGNSRPAFKGRCLCAKDFTSAVVIFVMIVTFTALFIYSWFDYGAKIAISDEKMSNTSPSSPTASSTNGYEKCNGHFRAHYVPAIVQIVLAIVTVVAMLLTVATNPGVLLKQVGKNAKNHRPPPGHLDYVEVGGVQVFMPYCDTCNIVRPPRSSHCIKCNNCVDKFDHHCGIIGACIGKRNFRQFLIFLYSMIAMGLWSLLWSVFLAWVIFPTEDTVNKVFAICVAIASSLALCVLSFMGTHYIKLISNGYTQREYLKKEKLYPAGKNPYDDGCWKNWKEVCGL